MAWFITRMRSRTRKGSRQISARRHHLVRRSGVDLFRPCRRGRMRCIRTWIWGTNCPSRQLGVSFTPLTLSTLVHMPTHRSPITPRHPAVLARQPARRTPTVSPARITGTPLPTIHPSAIWRNRDTMYYLRIVIPVAMFRSRPVSQKSRPHIARFRVPTTYPVHT